MNWHNIKWTQMLAGFAATLVILLLGNYLWQRTAVERPLLQVLKQDEAVIKAAFISDGRKPTVEVVLGDLTHLSLAVRRIDAMIKKMQPNVAQVIYQDLSNEALERVYDRLHFAVYEAKATGNFVTLEERFLSIVSDSSLTFYRLEVDSEAIYVQLHDGGSYLYRVVALDVSE